MYLKLIYLCCVTTCALAAPLVDEVPLGPQQTPVVPIISISAEYEPNGKFKYNYETGDGIKREETAYDKVSPQSKSHSDCSNEGGEDDDSGEIHVQKGSYSYTAPDGTLVSVRYIADENGFQPIINEVTHASSQVSNNLTPNTEELYHRKVTNDKKVKPEVTSSNKTSSDFPNQSEQMNQEHSEKTPLKFGDRLVQKNEKPTKILNKENDIDKNQNPLIRENNVGSKDSKSESGNKKEITHNNNLLKPEGNDTTPTKLKDESDQINKTSGLNKNRGENNEKVTFMTELPKDKMNSEAKYNVTKNEKIEPIQKSDNNVTASIADNIKSDSPEAIETPSEENDALFSIINQNKNQTMSDKTTDENVNEIQQKPKNYVKMSEETLMTEATKSEMIAHEKENTTKTDNTKPQFKSGSKITAPKVNNNKSDDMKQNPKILSDKNDTLSLMLAGNTTKPDLDAKDKSTKKEKNEIDQQLQDDIETSAKNINKSNDMKEISKENMNPSENNNTISTESPKNKTDSHKKDKKTGIDEIEPQQKSENNVTAPKDNNYASKDTKEFLDGTKNPNKNEGKSDAQDKTPRKEKNEIEHKLMDDIKQPSENINKSDNIKKTSDENIHLSNKNDTISSMIESPKNETTLHEEDEKNEIESHHKSENNDTEPLENNNKIELKMGDNSTYQPSIPTKSPINFNDKEEKHDQNESSTISAKNVKDMVNTSNLNSTPEKVNNVIEDKKMSPDRNNDSTNLEKEAEKHEKKAEHAAQEAVKAAGVATDAADVAHKAAAATEKLVNTINHSTNESRKVAIEAAKKHAHLAGEAAQEAEEAAEMAENAAKDAKNAANAAERFVQLVQSSSKTNDFDKQIPGMNGNVDNAKKSSFNEKQKSNDLSGNS